MNNKKLYLMIGISGSGKSTYIKNNFPDACICSADHYFYDKNGVYEFSVTDLRFAHKSCQNKAKQFLSEGKENVVIDNTNTSMKEIKPYIKMAEEYGYEINFIKFDCPVSIGAERNLHNVPDYAIEKQYKRLKNLKLPEHYNIRTIYNETFNTK